MSYLSKSVHDDEDVSVDYFYKNIRWKRVHVIHRNITRAAFGRGQKSESVLIALARGLGSSVSIVIVDEATDYFIYISLLIYLGEKFKIFLATRIIVGGAIVN